MLRKLIYLLFCLLFTAVLINAQTKNLPIKLGIKKVAVQGKVFNEIEYNFSGSKNKYVAYFQIDKVKKTLIITEISYEFENGKENAAKVEIYTCPLAKINKKESYNLEMEDEAVSGGKYWRLTLLTNGSGADNLFFQKQTITAEDTANERVNNVTINILKKSEAEKWLKIFTK